MVKEHFTTPQKSIIQELGRKVKEMDLEQYSLKMEN